MPREGLPLLREGGPITYEARPSRCSSSEASQIETGPGHFLGHFLGTARGNSVKLQPRFDPPRKTGGVDLLGHLVPQQSYMKRESNQHFLAIKFTAQYVRY